MDLTIEALEGLRRDLQMYVSVNTQDVDRALAELIRIKKTDTERLKFLVGTVYTRESSMNMRISMRLSGVFVHWKNGDPSLHRLEVSTRWLVPCRDGSETREVKRDFDEYISDEEQLKEITAWLEAPTTLHPVCVVRILNRACADAMYHEIEENLFNGSVRVRDPHKDGA